MNRFMLAAIPLSGVATGLAMREFGLPLWLYVSTGIVLLVIGGIVEYLMLRKDARKYS